MRAPFSRLLLLTLAAMLAACASPRPAPVSERTAPVRQAASAPSAPQAKPVSSGAEPQRDVYTVKPGDTLYSIALEHGLDYRELAIWNGIENPNALRVGQQLRLVAPASAAVALPLKTPGGVEAKPLGAPLEAKSLGAKPSQPSGLSGDKVLSEPKGVRVPYSEQAFAQLSGADTAAPARSETRADARAPARPDSAGETARGPDDVDWAWPATGKIISTFNEASSKGIAITGRLGQPVLASAPGRVIFSGTGIRGFGKLIVIKHNNTYLSVYAHNSELLVKEGQNVSRGQKIAEMGNTDADQVKLHFEIRRFGKPIDPLKLLPDRAA